MYIVHEWCHFLVCNTHVLHFVCFGEETWNCMHFLVILSLKTLWAGVKRWWTALHRFYVYRNIYFISRVQKCVYLKCFCAWCLDNWSWGLSGKPFNTFSMTRLKTLQFHLTLTPLFTATHTLFCRSFTIFFMICDWGIWFILVWPLIYGSYIEPPCFVKFSKMANIKFRELWFGFFFISWDVWPETPTPPFFL